MLRVRGFHRMRHGVRGDVALGEGEGGGTAPGNRTSQGARIERACLGFDKSRQQCGSRRFGDGVIDRHAQGVEIALHERENQ